MKANDLRKGNIVYNGYEGGNEILSAFQISQIEVMNNGGNVAEYYRSLEYIPLTEEWLLKIEFEHTLTIGQRKIYTLGNLGIELSGKEYAVYFIDELLCFKKYLHQLQNIVFDLWDKELTIKE